MPVLVLYCRPVLYYILIVQCYLPSTDEVLIIHDSHYFVSNGKSVTTNQYWRNTEFFVNFVTIWIGPTGNTRIILYFNYYIFDLSIFNIFTFFSILYNYIHFLSYTYFPWFDKKCEIYEFTNNYKIMFESVKVLCN